ncbi:unnamed protein product (macronuclear) [Paramecium tetraurelia]|uniref:Aminopeptidase n=2 Tax=Paramecium tetraurelia TaxID=5888 RepID=A0D4H7_PARTE|nr:uncharacterized protein GSPATT00013410001 [Paramecium tetraurelia]CAK77944.1 unnamed protein product [Paramecium tetraurelia]|eukprot:XP_001445341.1 hypothetical protein (macronuclear) [Paramecium tetraurelia strain d4-2]
MLTKQQAFKRSESLSEVDYRIYVELLRGKVYRGVIFISVHIHKSDGLFFDWQGGKLDGVTVNGNAVEWKLEEGFITLVGQENLQGQTEIRINFENEYSTTGYGLHSFIDSDEQQYLYSQCEPHHFSKMFPCFDQPDLKGTLKLIAQAPKEWKIISNEKKVEGNLQNIELVLVQELGYIQHKDDYQIQEFVKTKKLSTYLYAVVAGPYEEIKCEELHNGIEMSLFCRVSLKQFLQGDSNDIFKLTKDGMKYYEQLFQFPYPFSKYDQIFCPEYATGAMENAGAVTINDNQIFKEEVPIDQIAQRGNVLLHELSHMWFGDLVTMKWWDDLWLNESFAEFISHLCQTKVHNIPIDHWVEFLKSKIWGYITDQRNTTHPIFCDVQNTDQADNIFDGITYAKGAALLKQLFTMMGEQKFSQAMGQYFNKYQYSNTTLADFFGVLKQQFEGDYLLQWQQDWIMKAGLNLVELTSVNEKSYTFKQTATLKDLHPTLRNQMFKVGLYDHDGKELEVKLIQLNPTEETVLEFEHQNAYVLLNFDDGSFVKTSYSQQQADFFLKNLSNLSTINRVLVLRSIWDQVRDGLTGFTTFINGVLKSLLNETDDAVLQMVLEWCTGGVSFYCPIKHRQTFENELAHVIIELLRKCPKENKNKRLILLDYLALWGTSQQNLEFLLQHINSDDAEFGFIGLSNGWRIIRNIFANLNIPKEQKWQLFEKWAQRDGTDEVRLQKRFLENLFNFDKLWDYFINYNKEESIPMVREAMAAFNHKIYLEQLQTYEQKYFEALPTIFSTKSSEYAKEFYHSLYPINDNINSYIELCEKTLLKSQHDILTKFLKDSIDADQRRLKTYKFFLDPK